MKSGQQLTMRISIDYTQQLTLKHFPLFIFLICFEMLSHQAVLIANEMLAFIKAQNAVPKRPTGTGQHGTVSQQSLFTFPIVPLDNIHLLYTRNHHSLNVRYSLRRSAMI